jgi:hypothetical protein
MVFANKKIIHFQHMLNFIAKILLLQNKLRKIVYKLYLIIIIFNSYLLTNY